MWASDPPAARKLDWQGQPLGALPSGWRAEQTGTGVGSVWKLVADASAPSRSGVVLAQTAEGPNALFNLAIPTDSRFREGTLRVHCKAIAGKLDQGGGLLWRYQDAKNYYVGRYNPLERNFRVYKVIAGQRTQLQSREDLDIPTGRWFQVSVTHRGDVIRCALDGKVMLEVRDDALPRAGAFGLWTKADAQSHFDGLEILVDP